MRALLFTLLLPSLAQAQIDYIVTPMPASRQVAVSMTVPVPEGRSELTFRIPQWCPGFYRLIPYFKKIVDVRFTDDTGMSIPVAAPASDAIWKIQTGEAKSVTARYFVFGDDPGLGFFGVNVREHTVFLNGPATFFYVDGMKDVQTRVKFALPDGWDAATAMDRDPDGRYVSGGYDELLDHPIRLGKFERRRFEVDGIPFESIWASQDQKYRPDFDAENAMLAKVSRVAMQVFGGKPPFKRYLYFINLSVGDFSGGLEHRSSTVIALPNSRRMGMETLAAHEFFHSWNVKQIRPKVLGPFDYTQPNRTGNLWFAEGVTDYYAQLVCYRAGLYDEGWLMGALGGEIQELQRSSMRLKKTVEEVSRETWEHGGFGVGDLSYYNKGLVTGLLLDAQIRAATRGAKSLDDVMRLLDQRHRLPKPGYDEDGIKSAVNEIAGKDLSAKYELMVRSTKELPYEDLAAIGLRAIPPNVPSRRLGFILRGAVIVSVEPAIAQLGIREGDSLLMVNGEPSIIGLAKVRDAYDAVIVRGAERAAFRLPVLTASSPRWRLEIDPFAPQEAQRLLRGFLQRPTTPD